MKLLKIPFCYCCMNYDPLNLSNMRNQNFKKTTYSPKVISLRLKFAAHNSDIVEPYYWHLGFPYFVGKGFKPIKLEDQHYFSEASQFGQGIRQIKGGSIRAFQENLQQLVQLVKVNLFPLLKEVKEAHFYKKWLDKIVENDHYLHEELAKTSPDPQRVKKFRSERDEAILHIKDKWINEVDGGRLWQMQRPAAEQGLDYALLPQLFFGTKLDDPFERGKTIKQQLDDYVYGVDVTQEVLIQLARFHYRFYTWLPTAIRETQTTFKIKVSTLKQFYTQLQMYINFMKPLLIEISKKSEGFESDSFYRGYETENPEVSNMLDYSYSFVRILGIRKFERDQFEMKQLDFLRDGFFVDASKKGEHMIIFGEQKGKNGFIIGEDGDKYLFKIFKGSRDEASRITRDEFDKLKEVKIHKRDLRTFSVMEWKFSQKRRSEVVNTQQGPQQVPFMVNQIEYVGNAWNLYEVACYREKIKEDNLLLLESFVEEIAIIKDELLYYVNDLEGEPPWEKKEFDVKKQKEEEIKKEKEDRANLILGPLQGLGMLFEPLFPKSGHSKKAEKTRKELAQTDRDENYELTRRHASEDVWKTYTVFKKSHGHIQY